MHRLLSDRAWGWRRALCGIVLGLLAWSAHGVPAKAPQDLRIDGEVLPGKSVDLLEQALSRVKFNTDPQQLRRGLVENRLLARAVEDQLTAQSRADLDASVEIEAGNLLRTGIRQALPRGPRAIPAPAPGPERGAFARGAGAEEPRPGGKQPAAGRDAAPRRRPGSS
ncbi:hypothetical protein AAHB60_01530 [Pseudomonas aeruginosa]